MASLRGPRGADLPLFERTLVGRSRACDLRLDDPKASGEHARLRWDGAGWALSDLSSRNGTWLDGARLGEGEVRTLELGARVAFGCPEAEWILVEDGPPVALARAGETIIVAEDGLLALPDANDPQVTIFRAASGEWVLERPSGVEVVDDREQVELAGRLWLLHLPGALASTAALTAEGRPKTLADAILELRVSHDQEHVEAAMRVDRARVDLGARVHHGLLVELARERLADAERRDLAEPDRGWLHTEALCERLRVDVSHLNILIHRARRQLAKAGVVDGPGVIERRPGTGQLRLGPCAVELELG